MRRFLIVLVALAFPALAVAQERDIVITGGWLFAATGPDRVQNPGIVVRAGKLLRVGGDLSIAAGNAETIRLADDETIIPGLFDLHAHYAMDLFGRGRVDDVAAGQGRPRAAVSRP